RFNTKIVLFIDRLEYIPVVFQVAALLAALTHPGHIVIYAPGIRSLPSRCILKSNGYSWLNYNLKSIRHKVNFGIKTRPTPIITVQYQKPPLISMCAVWYSDSP
ncbi:hypothetical protein, partial [Xenorhabdus koppenhoeferi]|uniref:hypothetical protein n=1 Tax=Xenorhabdus koppenhoeferi TaxID=351659 RepID=UPI002B40C4FA